MVLSQNEYTHGYAISLKVHRAGIHIRMHVRYIRACLFLFLFFGVKLMMCAIVVMMKSDGCTLTATMMNIRGVFTVFGTCIVVTR